MMIQELVKYFLPVQIITADAIAGLKQLPDESAHCCVTSPPYWGLRDYGVTGQIGLEQTPDEYVARIAEVFREVRRVLRSDGTLWLNLGDSYARNGGVDKKVSKSAKVGNTIKLIQNRNQKTPIGLKEKDLVGIPWMVAFALRADGWYLRQEIIWHKPNPIPESVLDRCTKAHEQIFLLSKNKQYFFDADAIKEPVSGTAHARRSIKNDSPVKVGPKCANASFGVKSCESFRIGTGNLVDMRNKRSVWTIATQPFPEAHFATFPEKLPETCILAGCPVGGVVLDPFGGAGTTDLVAKKLGRKAVLIELNPEYARMARKRIFSQR